MGRITISSNGKYFEKDGAPLFLLSDTDWMAFQKLSLSEWEEAVHIRRAQGFRAMQISVLPIAHDNSQFEGGLEPFAKRPDGSMDFSSVNEAYFDRAAQMLEILCHNGLIPFLHLFWANYIPDTWAAAKSPGTVIPLERLEPLAEWVLRRFRKYSPVYSVSGDTSFETPRVIQYYRTILDVLHRIDPEGLTTLHLQPGADPPEELCAHPQYHFYSFQSGHGVTPPWDQTGVIRLCDQFRSKPRRKPIVNTEPCYEAASYGFAYGRFSAFDVRKALWSSLLSGAGAGVTYGAHGVWMFYHQGERFNGIDFSGQPLAWRDALRLPGAWDAGFAAWLYQRYGLWDLEPDSRIQARSGEVRMASSENRVAVYAPYNDPIRMDVDLTGWDCEQIALDSRNRIIPNISFQDGKTTVGLSPLNEDTLFLACKK